MQKICFNIGNNELPEDAVLEVLADLLWVKTQRQTYSMLSTTSA